ncbi:MAG: hypothetical protein KAI47_20775, partial [Deltaproteobacteria bacterium]|nr:hypothetical protein [Deltaproteobacteria bacterium]
SLARAQRLSGDPAAALQILVPLVAPTRSPSRRKLQALVAEASVKAVLDDHSGVLATVAQALGFLERDPDMGSLSLEAELWGWRAWALGHGDRHAEAAEAFEAALTRARSAGARRVEADLLNRWAVVSWRHGDYDGVEARYGRALDTLREIGEIERIAVVRFNLGGFQLQRGLLAPALDHLEAALRLFEGMGTQQHASSARCNLGQLYLELGLYEKAQTISERALGEMRASGRRSGEALARLLLALVAGRRGELESARRGVAEARELFLGVKQTRDAADAALDLAEVELEAGEFVAAEILVDQAEGEGAKDEVADLEIRALTLRARVLARGEATGILHARQIMERAFARAAELR